MRTEPLRLALLLTLAPLAWLGCGRGDLVECRGGAPVAGLCSRPVPSTARGRGGGPMDREATAPSGRDGGLLRPDLEPLPGGGVRVGPP